MHCRVVAIHLRSIKLH